MILSHITCWSNTRAATIDPMKSLYKQALKTLDKKPYGYHNGHILQKYKLLSWDNIRKFKTSV